jgi:hypothetical protein
MTPMPTQAERMRRRIALAISLLLNAAFSVVVDLAMRPQPRDFPSRSQPIQVRLIEIAESPPAPAFEPPAQPLVLLPPPTAPIRRAPRVHAITSREPVATTARVEAPPSPPPSAPPPLRLVGTDGRILLPDSMTASPSASVATTDEPPLRDAFARRNPVPYTPTRFDKYFPPVEETLGGEIVRKTTVTRTFLTPWGTQITCSASLLMFGMGGCGWGYAPQLSADEMHAMHADPPLPPPSLLPHPPESPPPASPVPNAKFSIVH